MCYRVCALIGLLGFLSWSSSPLIDAAEPQVSSIPASDRDFFEKEVRPLLVKRCFECHGGTKAGGGLSLASAKGWAIGGESGPAIVPGQPDQSLLIDAINHRTLVMPPTEDGLEKLPADEIAVLTQWVAMGAPDPRDGSDILGGMTVEAARDWWAFQPLPEVPAASLAADASRIDEILEQPQRQHGLPLTPEADRRTLIRRLTYNLTGLPPTPDEVDAFVADQSPEAWSHAIERLLASPQYGVHWGRRWLDVVRYADTAGENTDRPLPHAWRYRNWVMNCFADDVPFDQFIRQQLAGDLLTRDDTSEQRAEGIIATGYLAIARRFGHDIDQDMHLTYEDVIDNLGKTFLGLSLGCARCHDHKYDPVSAEDYYALHGIFESTQFAFSGCEAKGQPRDLVPLIPQGEAEALTRPWREQQERRALFQQRRADLARAVFRPETAEATRLVQAGLVNEGASVDIPARQFAVRRGEIVLLTVEPGDNHGADSTLAELRFAEVGGERRQWSTGDVIDGFAGSNPRTSHDASWCYLELTKDGPQFLGEPGDAIGGNPALKKWSLGDTPSVFVNTSDQPVAVWTTLPAHSFFVHPGPGRPVAVAWISPLDGEVELSGRITDAHPAGLDGVRFRLEHIAQATTGPALLAAGQPWSEPAVGPEPVIPVAYAVVDRVARNARFLERGDPEKLGDEIPRRWLTIFGGAAVPVAAGSGRLELGDWVSRHPLAARVMVNRIWGWHFGRGLVRSPNDFGARGEAPTHSELLDFLAARFVQSGYSVKALQRLILRTAAYQRATGPASPEDPDNRWLAHWDRRRLTAEELRDSLLLASGQLDVSPGESHPFPPENTWSFTQHTPFSAVYETNRRSAFLMVQRQRRHPFLSLFDGPDPNASTPSRPATTVPTQALYFLNDPFFHAQADALARRVLAAAADPARIHQMYRIVFVRNPTPAEADRVQRFLESYPGEAGEKWSAVARILLASNEFLFVE